MSDNRIEIEALLIQRVAHKEDCAIAELCGLVRDPLERIIRTRLDRRLQGRVAPSDIVQEGLMKVIARAPEYVNGARRMPVFEWILLLTKQCLITCYREHIGSKKRDVTRDVRIDDRANPPVQGNLTSPTQAARRRESQERVRKAIASMREIDREVLHLRHFEELSNAEVAAILGLRTSTASARYAAAIKRLGKILHGKAKFLED